MSGIRLLGYCGIDPLRFALVRSSGMLLLFDSDNTGRPPVVSVDLFDAAVVSKEFSFGPVVQITTKLGLQFSIRPASKSKALGNVFSALSSLRDVGDDTSSNQRVLL